MATDIERLIETLIDEVSCHGDLGCSVRHVLDTLDSFLSDTAHRESHQDSATYSSRQTLWDWLRFREDVSIGKSRKWNHLGLSEVLSMPEEPTPIAPSSGSTDQVSPDDASATQATTAITPQLGSKKDMPSFQYRPKVYASEARMWQSLAGHGADFKRVPRMEWAALVGIASTKEEGVIQGDLCRLIGQDKRSLPRRTDALAQKGYIVKRTTLIRGVKTSKMWLQRYAPLLSTNSAAVNGAGKSAKNGQISINLVPENLNKDIEPVAWRSRWTGGAIDMQSLAETAIAIVKAFGIIRYHDLRKKLGILALPWQMKTTARFCRWMVRRGIVQYVGATLGDRLYKDCIKYVRDFTSNDWADWLKTGKEKSRPKTDASLDAYRDKPVGNETNARTKSSERGIDIVVAWKPEKPLPTTVIDAIRAGSPKGVTNRYIGAHTMGPPFSRYITSVSTTLATQSLQPRHLAHFQVFKELQRVKKQSIYFFSIPNIRADANKVAERTLAQGTSTGNTRDDAASSSEQLKQYFSLIASDEIVSDSANLTKLSRMIELRAGLPTNKSSQKLAVAFDSPRASVPAEERSQMIIAEPKTTAIGRDEFSISSGTQSLRISSPTTRRGPFRDKDSRFILTFKVPAARLAALLKAHDRLPRGQSRVVGATPSPNRDLAIDSGIFSGLNSHDNSELNQHGVSQTYQADLVQGYTPQPSEDICLTAPTEPPYSESNLPGRSKRGRPKTAAKKQHSRSKPGGYICEKCGRAWRNDNGLKYHLEKSSSPCNPTYIPPPPKPSTLPVKRRLVPLHASLYEVGMAGEGRPRRTRNTPARVRAVERSPTTALRSDNQYSDVPSMTRQVPSLHTRPIRRRDVRPVSDRSYDSTAQTASQQQPLLGVSEFGRVIGVDEAGILIENPCAGSKDTGKRRGTVPDLINPRSHRKEVRSSTGGPAFGLSPEICWTKPPHAADSLPNDSDVGFEGETGGEQIHRPTEKERIDLEAVNTPMLAADDDSRLFGPATITQSPENPGTIQFNTILPAFKMPDELDKPTPTSQRQYSQVQRCSNIVQYLINNHGGCFPGERTLWYALTAVWERTFPSEATPSWATTQNTIKKMEEKQLLKKTTHAFRDTKGAFQSVTVLLSPDASWESPMALAWKDKMIAKYPEVLIVSGLVPKSNLLEERTWNGKPVFSTRRKLAQTLEVLDAPVYAVAPLRRRRGRNRPSPSPRKKQKLHSGGAAQVSRDPGGGEQRSQETRLVRRVLLGGPAGSQHDIVSRPTEHRHAPVTFTFLEPNSRLDEDEAQAQYWTQTPQHGSQARSQSLVRRQEALPAVENAPGKLVVERGGSSFTQIIQLQQDSSGIWTRLRSEFFERNASFAMKGWLPSTRESFPRCLPRDLADIMGSRWLRRQEMMPETTYGDFELQITKCQSWELDKDRRKQLLCLQSVAPSYVWINHVANLPVMEGVPDVCGWVTENESTWGDAMVNSNVVEINAKRRRGVAHTRGGTGGAIVPRDPPVEFKTRKMTPWNGVAKDGKPLSGIRHLESNDNDVLIAAFVASRTLLGGADKYIEWGLLMRLFPDKSLAWLRRFWSKTRKERSVSINNLTKRFQKQYVRAYERNELPPIDYNDPLGYDWVKIIEWTMHLVGEAATLPPSRNELQRDYVVKTGVADTNDWQRVYYNVQSSMFSRLEALTSKAICCPVDFAGPNRTIENVDTHKATSWIRALCGTKPGLYDPALVRQKVSSITPNGDEYNSSLVAQAIATLQQKSIITRSKSRAGDLGSHRFSDWFLPRLEKFSHAQKYQEANLFKAELDDIFRKNQSYHIPYVLRDGEVMAMVNMQFSGRIKVTPVDVPHIPLGFKPGFYESRKFPKSFYNFGLNVTPTESYVYSEDMVLLHAVENRPVPRESSEGGLPLWSDIFGNPDEQRWGQVIKAIAFVVAMRGPVDLDGIVLALEPCLDHFEVRLAVEWALKNQVVKMTPHGTSYTTDEWWWLVAGRRG